MRAESYAPSDSNPVLNTVDWISHAPSTRTYSSV
ncbi:hypothetical protein CBM2633_B60273 [Cupriavidus taiwanensis]|nr:hypothetical protein CBM2633_B60273 [Cupriavidus taiwanensis]